MLDMLNSFCAWLLAAVITISSGLGLWAEPAVPVLTEPEETEMMEITADYVIVTGAEANAVEQNAANILKYYLKQISGLDLAVVPDTGNHEKEMIVGKTSREGVLYTLDRAALGTDGVMLKTIGDDVVITGGQERGVLYAVYTFLEDYLGCRWFSADVTVIPELEKLEIPKDIDYTHVPALAYRETDWISPRDHTFSAANKLNANIYRKLSAENGGCVGYIGNFAHTLANTFMNASVYYESHPEYYAWRTDTQSYFEEQLCLTNPDVFHIVLAEVKAAIDANAAEGNNYNIVSLTQHDNQKYCQCDNCAAVDKEEESHAGTMIRFVNAIATELAKEDAYKDIYIDTFAYQYTRQAPKTVRPHKNVIVRLCSIECCFVHTLDDEACQENADFMQDLKDWSKICDQLYIWDYTTNYGNYNGPFNNWAVMQANMQTFVEHNVVGVYEEGNYQASQSNGEFADLRAYVLSKLLWDENTDVDRHMVEFCRAYYGPAWTNVMKYIVRTTERAGQPYLGKLQHMGIFDNVANRGVMQLSPLDISYINQLWEDAKAEDLTAEQLARVRRSEISWRYWKATKQIREFNLFTRKASSEQLYADMKELGIVRIHEGEKGLLAEKPYMLDVPGRWSIGKVPSFPEGWYY